MDFRLKKEMVDHLQNAIDNPPPQSETDMSMYLAGNISTSKFIEDKDNLFYNNVLKGVTEHLYYGEWGNYYNVCIEETIPPPIFELDSMWVNYQKQHEFNPPHNHGGLYSFVVFMKIPTHWKEQHALPFSANSNAPSASDFSFVVVNRQLGRVEYPNIPLSPEDEGRMLFFPATLGHQVYPFYECEEERITISGNIHMRQKKEKGNKDIEELKITLKQTEKEVKSIKTKIKNLQQTIRK
jgi:hypothetical protein